MRGDQAANRCQLGDLPCHQGTAPSGHRSLTNPEPPVTAAAGTQDVSATDKLLLQGLGADQQPKLASHTSHCC